MTKVSKHVFHLSMCQCVIASLLLMVSPAARGAVKLPRLISDGIVLQRDIKIPIWGWASPGEEITVNFNSKTYHTKTDNEKNWRIYIDRQSAGGPFEMTIQGQNKIVIKNILIGDVWLCAGQSNMEFPMQRARDKYAREIENSANAHIRQFLIRRKYSYEPLTDTESEGWTEASPAAVLKFSAVAYFFANELYHKYHVPIGVITSSVGGTPAQSWISEQGLKEFPGYLNSYLTYKNDPDKVKETEQSNKSLNDEWYKEIKAQSAVFFSNHRGAWVYGGDSTWKKMFIPGTSLKQGIKELAGMLLFRKEVVIPSTMIGKDADLYLGAIADQDSTYFNGRLIGSTNSRGPGRKYTIPARLIKVGSNIITVNVLNLSGNYEFVEGKPYKIISKADTVTLNGEWNYKVIAGSTPYPSGKVIQFLNQPAVLYNSMIAPLVPFGIKGVLWYQGESNTGRSYEYRKLFPALITDWRGKWNDDFPFIYVQLANYGLKAPVPMESDWAELREAQLKTLIVPKTGMVVTHDIGEGNDIHPLDKLDVGVRASLAAQKVAYHEKDIIASGPVYKSFQIKGDRCIITFTNTGSGLISKGDTLLKQFAVAAADQKFIWAKAWVKDDEVIVWSDKIKNPVAVRYAWSNNPEGANLYNKEGLPATSFRTDDWPRLK